MIWSANRQTQSDINGYPGRNGEKSLKVLRLSCLVLLTGCASAQYLQNVDPDTGQPLAQVDWISQRWCEAMSADIYEKTSIQSICSSDDASDALSWSAELSHKFMDKPIRAWFADKSNCEAFIRQSLQGNGGVYLTVTKRCTETVSI